MKGFPKQAHLVGVGGEGMAALARLLLEYGVEVSGSDLRPSPRLDELATLGAAVHLGHRPDHLPPGTEMVIFSSAIPGANPELVAAREHRIPLRPRLWALRELLRQRPLVAVAGTHGKTTTTAWLSYLLGEVAEQGGYYVGAELPGRPSARLGTGPFVMEVDESDGLFTGLRPWVAVITNVDADHLVTYGGYARLRHAFSRFVEGAGRVAVCLDDPGARELLRTRPDAFTFGLHPRADLRARGIRFQRSWSTFEVWLSGRRLAEVILPAPGRHNVRNALAALAGGILVGLPARELCRWLPQVPRPRRRLEVLEENGYLVVDDYAHHPRELAAGLAALRHGWPERRVVAIFQPHRYTRTARHAGAFGQVLAQADRVVVTEVYPAFEAPIPGVSGAQVAQATNAAGGKAVFKSTLVQAMEAAQGLIAPGDVVACFGAGDVWRLARGMARGLSSGA